MKKVIDNTILTEAAHKINAILAANNIEGSATVQHRLSPENVKTDGSVQVDFLLKVEDHFEAIGYTIGSEEEHVIWHASFVGDKNDYNHTPWDIEKLTGIDKLIYDEEEIYDILVSLFDELK